MDGTTISRQRDDKLDLNGEPALDVSELDPTFAEKVGGSLFQPWLLRVLRTVCPTVKFGDLLFVTRYEDVRAVIEHDRVFHVEGARIAEANGGPNFVLGMQDDKGCPYHRLAGRAPVGTEHPYRNYQSLVLQHFALEDTETLRALMRRTAEAAVGQRLHMDAIGELITHVTIAVCREYYGVNVGTTPAQESDFANTSFAVSRWLFDPFPTSRFRDLALRASVRLNNIVERSIDLAVHDARDTVIRRMLDANVPREQIRVIVVGMILGFVPTSTLGAGNILQVLIERKEAFDAAQAAVRADDDVRLERCLFEAFRFKPLVREPLRVCQETFTLSEGTWHKRTLRHGDRLIALTTSAMMDETHVQHPEVFDPDRPPHQRFLYGSGLHRCIGAPIATLHILEALRPLLKARSIRQLKDNGGMKAYLGPFHKHLLVELMR